MKKYVSKLATVSFILLAVSALVYFLARTFIPVADFINGTVSVAVRCVLAFLTYVLPFSLFETLIILSPLIIAFTVFIMVKGAKKRPNRIRALVSLLGIVSLIFTSYIYTLGVGYHTTPLSYRIGIEDKRDVNEDELFDTLCTVVEELNSLAEKIESSDGVTHMPFDFFDLSRELTSAYDSVNEKYSLFVNYPSRAKPVYFSTVMSDLGITGIYSFFTGEANVNVEYPDYSTVFTTAHELAHQRGICRENEANFVAFLVCIGSENEYIRYSGYLNIYEYLSSALYRADPERYMLVRDTLSEVAKGDIRASNEVYQKHKDSLLGKINDRLNDAYLKANGTEGVVSYGYVVRLAVSYYQSEYSK